MVLCHGIILYPIMVFPNSIVLYLCIILHHILFYVNKIPPSTLTPAPVPTPAHFFAVSCYKI